MHFNKHTQAHRSGGKPGQNIHNNKNNTNKKRKISILHKFCLIYYRYFIYKELTKIFIHSLQCRLFKFYHSRNNFFPLG